MCVMKPFTVSGWSAGVNLDGPVWQMLFGIYLDSIGVITGKCTSSCWSFIHSFIHILPITNTKSDWEKMFSLWGSQMALRDFKFVLCHPEMLEAPFTAPCNPLSFPTKPHVLWLCTFLALKQTRKGTRCSTRFRMGWRRLRIFCCFFFQ